MSDPIEHELAHEEIGLNAALIKGIIGADNLPAYVDEVLEYANLAAFPATGAAGKIYVALNTVVSYRWSGSAYFLINENTTEMQTDIATLQTDVSALQADAVALQAAHRGVLAVLVDGAEISVGADHPVFAAVYFYGGSGGTSTVELADALETKTLGMTTLINASDTVLQVFFTSNPGNAITIPPVGVRLVFVVNFGAPQFIDILGSYALKP